MYLLYLYLVQVIDGPPIDFLIIHISDIYHRSDLDKISYCRHRTNFMSG